MRREYDVRPLLELSVSLPVGLREGIFKYDVQALNLFGQAEGGLRLSNRSFGSSTIRNSCAASWTAKVRSTTFPSFAEHFILIP